MTSITKFRLQVIKERTGEYEINETIRNPRDVMVALNDLFDLSQQAEEVLLLVTLDTKHSVTGVFEVSRGTLNNALVHPREIYKRAILQNAAAVILCHNHPSGDTWPSDDDKAITKRMKDAGELLGIQVLDHIIVGDDGIQYTSLRDLGDL